MNALQIRNLKIKYQFTAYKKPFSTPTPTPLLLVDILGIILHSCVMQLKNAALFKIFTPSKPSTLN